MSISPDPPLTVCLREGFTNLIDQVKETWIKLGLPVCCACKGFAYGHRTLLFLLSFRLENNSPLSLEKPVISYFLQHFHFLCFSFLECGKFQV
jgi:hypothetical protein